MRTKQLYPGINDGQKIRVIVNGVGIYTTVAGTQSIFATTHHRAAVEFALSKISSNGGLITSYSSRWNEIDFYFQVDLL